MTSNPWVGEIVTPPISPTSEVGKIQIDLQGSDRYITVNFDLNILISGLSQTKLMGQLTYQA